MKKHRLTTLTGQVITLSTCDTFTLAIGRERTESTPRDLAQLFSRRTLLAVKARTTNASERAKLEKAILMADYLAK